MIWLNKGNDMLYTLEGNKVLCKEPEDSSWSFSSYTHDLAFFKESVNNPKRFVPLSGVSLENK